MTSNRDSKQFCFGPVAVLALLEQDGPQSEWKLQDFELTQAGPGNRLLAMALREACAELKRELFDSEDDAYKVIQQRLSLVFPPNNQNPLT